MISSKRLVEIARKWQRMAVRGRKRISFGGLQKSSTKRKAAAVAEKGHFVAYAADVKRYMLPMCYLQRPIFEELFNMAEEEFGLDNNDTITLPCDSLVMDYILSLLHENMSMQMEDALLVSLSSTRCLSSSELPQSHVCHHLPLGVF